MKRLFYRGVVFLAKKVELILYESWLRLGNKRSTTWVAKAWPEMHPPER